MEEERQKYEKRANTLKALAHPVRLQILEELCVKKTNVTALYTKLGMPQSTISRHLLILKNAGIISGERRGLEIDYSLDCEKMETFIKVIIAE